MIEVLTKQLNRYLARFDGLEVPSWGIGLALIAAGFGVGELLATVFVYVTAGGSVLEGIESALQRPGKTIFHLFLVPVSIVLVAPCYDILLAKINSKTPLGRAGEPTSHGGDELSSKSPLRGLPLLPSLLWEGLLLSFAIGVGVASRSGYANSPRANPAHLSEVGATKAEISDERALLEALRSRPKTLAAGLVSA